MGQYDVQAPQIEMPFETAGKGMQLRQMMQADQMAKQAMADDNSARAALQANPDGGDGYVAALGQSGNHKAYAAAVKSNLDAKKINADVAGTNATTNKTNNETAQHQFIMAGQLVGSWAKDPTVNKAKVTSGIQAALHMGVISPEVAQAKMGELDQVSDDPASLNGWAGNVLMQITNAHDQHSLTTVDANTAATNERIKAEGEANRNNQVKVQQMAATRQAAGGGSGSVGLTHGVKGLSPEQNEALYGPNGAVTTGKLDPMRVNGRTASIFADAFIHNPNIDMAKISGDIALGRNAGYRQKAMVAETLPHIMQNMVDAGKAIGFSDNRTIGKMQGWVKGEFNDPAMTEYMTQRNDALMSIAGVMRGLGMTDMAHKAEIEVSSPTMSPAALDAWMRGQMKSLQPRLDANRQIMQHPGQSMPPAAPGVPPRPGVPAPATSVQGPGQRPSVDINSFFK